MFDFFGNPIGMEPASYGGFDPKANQNRATVEPVGGYDPSGATPQGAQPPPPPAPPPPPPQQQAPPPQRPPPQQFPQQPRRAPDNTPEIVAQVVEAKFPMPSFALVMNTIDAVGRRTPWWLWVTLGIFLGRWAHKKWSI